MKDRSTFLSGLLSHELVGAAARWILGIVFIYMGLNKAVHPVDFLKILREYHIVESHVVLNLIAAALPWFEVLSVPHCHHERNRQYVSDPRVGGLPAKRKHLLEQAGAGAAGAGRRAE